MIYIFVLIIFVRQLLHLYTTCLLNLQAEQTCWLLHSVQTDFRKQLDAPCAYMAHSLMRFLQLTDASIFYNIKIFYSSHFIFRDLISIELNCINGVIKCRSRCLILTTLRGWMLNEIWNSSIIVAVVTVGSANKMSFNSLSWCLIGWVWKLMSESLSFVIMSS